MAQRRMFSLKIVDTDAFLDMPQSSQLLYFHLSMRADDDGFVSNPKKIMRTIGSQEDDLKVLFTKRFVLPFESGICVIKHWKIHNYIQSDRYVQTQYIKEKSMIEVDEETQKYRLKKGDSIQNVSKMDTQVRLGKDRLEVGKDRLVLEPLSPGDFAQEFFKGNGPCYEEIMEQIKNAGIPVEKIQKEIEAFIRYWTEPSRSGKKQRWEMERTFEVKRRIGTWFRNYDKFQKPNNNKYHVGVVGV